MFQCCVIRFASSVDLCTAYQHPLASHVQECYMTVNTILCCYLYSHSKQQRLTEEVHNETQTWTRHSMHMQLLSAHYSQFFASEFYCAILF